MILAQKSLIGLRRYAKCLTLLALAACACTRTPENCGDGGDTLDPGKQFCRDGAAWSKCGGNEYDPYAKFCSAEKTYDKCGGTDNYDPLREFCYANKVVLKCGDGATFDPGTQGCYSGIVKERCGTNFFDPNNEFCFTDVNNIKLIYNRCNGNKFDPTTQGCSGETVQPKCGTNYYNAETQFCDSNNVYPKCNGNEYDPAKAFCSGGAIYAKCGEQTYDPSRQTCNGTTVANIVGPPKCNGVEYDGATSFCYNNTTIIPKCGGAAYDTTTHTCNGTTVVAKIILPKCNGNEYDSTINFCYNNTVIPKCGGQAYNPALKMCDGNNIVDIVEYTVYFNANGGMDGVDPPKTVKIGAGKNINIPGQQTISRGGYSFGGWNTDRFGAGTGYHEGESYTVTGNVTMYVKWIPIRTITFDGNGATSGDPPEQMQADSGTAIRLPDNRTLAKTGYSFGGWNTNSAGTGIWYFADSAYSVAINITLYARWIVAPLSYGGQTYRTIIMPDGKIWMAENLNYATSDSWCYDGSTDNCDKYGRLYGWNTAMKVCPSGWRLPSRQEWRDLDIAADGFSALPGGRRNSDGSFRYAGRYGYWWTATESGSSDAYRRFMGYYSDFAYEYYGSKSDGYSVRCVLD